MVVIAVLIMLKYPFLNAMTDLQDVRDMAASIIWLFVINVFIENFRGVYKGIFKALNIQQRVLKAQSVCQLVINPVMVWFFTFKVGGKGLGLMGIWLANNLTEIILCSVYIYFIKTVNFVKIIQESKANINK